MRPVAYGAEGQPLYAHPPQPATTAAPVQEPSLLGNVPTEYPGETFDPRLRKQYANEPDIIHATRPLEPEHREPSQELQSLHEASKRRYPYLNLSRCEYVIIAVKRHPIGLVIPVLVTSVVMLVLLSLLFSYPLLVRDGLVEGLPSFPVVAIPVLLLTFLVGIGGFIAVWVYLQNKFFMTNESVIQEIQQSLFSRHEQTVSLGSIEDASFRQAGIMQLMFNYGSIRLSTEGEETTYQFQYVFNPKRQIAILNNAVEAFKNGRPVTFDD